MTPGSSNIFLPAMALLSSAGYRAIAMDTMGYGNSDSIGENRNIDDFADAVIDLIDSLQLRKIVLVGLSTGSVIAAATAIKRVDLVGKLVLIEPGRFNTSSAQSRGYFGDRTELDPEGEFLLRRWKQISTGFGGKLSLQQAFVLFVDALRSREHQHEAYQALVYYDLVGRLDQIVIPTLLITGEHSTRQEPIGTFVQGIHHSTYVEMPNVANAPPLEDPDGFVASFLDWLKLESH
jgi:pimeloyl-ACP methyl ester carboxylesterase